MSQIQPADPIARKKAILILGVATVVGGSVLFAIDSYHPSLEQWIINEPGSVLEKLTWVLIGLVVLCLPFLFAAGHFWRMGQFVIDAQRFPPPGIPVIRDTPVLTGKEALRRGRLCQVEAKVFGGCAVVMPVVLWWVLRSVLGDV
ncbi:MAG: hypothetical protein VST68_12520 [Nitrospirota bacterium]|nr:hypothetical protein [Nitrospirota bacterium]